MNISILIPCYNEERTIGTVIKDFKIHLPKAEIYVYDNNSHDATKKIASDAGAIVKSSTRQGKGHVVRHMFSDIEADVYILVDGDATYDASAISKMIHRLQKNRLDMVVAKRISTDPAAYRNGHLWGNKVLTMCISTLFGRQFTDILSGYRVLSRRFVKSFPALATGFETETELTVHALELRMNIEEIETPYFARPEGSASKLNTYKDGWRIFRTIIKLFRLERPLWFFGAISSILLMLGIALGIPILSTYLETGLVPRMPTVVLVTAFGISALQFLLTGLILDTVTHGRSEARRLVYLSLPAPPSVSKHPSISSS